MGEALEIVKTLVSPTEKLLDIAKGGVGALYQPKHIRRMADAKAYEINAIGEALRKNSDVIITYEQGSIVAKSPEFEEFIRRTQHRLAHQELQKQYNIESVVDNAYTELAKDQSVSQDPVDQDWIHRFFNCVEDISSEEMQQLWGKILAGEIRTPGSISLRTLNVLKNINSKEAGVFEKIAKFIIDVEADTENNCFMPVSESLFTKHQISYPDLLLLDDAGLVQMQENLSFLAELDSQKRETLRNRNWTATIYNKGSSMVKSAITAFPLTIAGVELFTIISSAWCDDQNEYFEDVLKSFFPPLNQFDLEIAFTKIHTKEDLHDQL